MILHVIYDPTCTIWSYMNYMIIHDPKWSYMYYVILHDPTMWSFLCDPTIWTYMLVELSPGMGSERSSCWPTRYSSRMPRWLSMYSRTRPFRTWDLLILDIRKSSSDRKVPDFGSGVGSSFEAMRSWTETAKKTKKCYLKTFCLRLLENTFYNP
jgi:hypothetical protein